MIKLDHVDTWIDYQLTKTGRKLEKGESNDHGSKFVPMLLIFVLNMSTNNKEGAAVSKNNQKVEISVTS